MPAPLALATLLALPALFGDATAKLGSPQPCGPGPTEGCYSNYVVLADLDGDGDLDAVFASGGGYYERGTAAPMAVYLNDGHATMTESSAAAVGSFTGRLRQVAVGDIDGDGDNDIIAPDSWGMQDDAVFVNDGQSPPTFANQGMARLGTKSRAGAVRLGDLDDDGDLDLVITDWGDAPPDSSGTARVYLNDGHGSFTELAGAVPQNTDHIGTGPIDVDLFDADGDFDLDLVIASRQGESLLFVNDGHGSFSDANARLADQPGLYVYGPDECDVDGDGDLDVWLDNGADQLLEQLEINDGAGTFTDETAARVAGNVAGADDNEVQCADLDGDGDLDAVVASLSDHERMLENDGHGKFELRAGVFPAVNDSTLGLDLGDLDGDGRLDAITAQGESPPFLNRLYLGTADAPVDARGPVIRDSYSRLDPGAGFVVRFAVSDAATSDVGPRLREAHVKIVESGREIPATFMGGDLFRALVDEDSLTTRSYQACATDAAGNSACGDAHRLTFGAEDAGPPPPTPDAGPGPGPGDDDGGCGCRVGARGAAGSAGMTILGALALVALSRRRRSG